MDSLESYFQTDYSRDTEQIQQVTHILEDAWQTFTHFGSADSWPYEVTDKTESGSPASASYSFSTNAMIQFAIAACSGQGVESPLLPRTTFPLNEGDGLTKLKDSLDDRLGKLLQNIELNDSKATESGTYGIDDPFSLTWALELAFFRPTTAEKYSDYVNKCFAQGCQLVKRAFAAPAEPLLKWKSPSPKNGLEHVFPLLRTIHLHETLNRFVKRGDDFAKAADYAECLAGC